MGFVKGQCYTRPEIRDLVGGGDVQTYLPNENGKVLCACLSQDYGPEPASVILVGQGPTVQREAAMLCAQADAIPVFYKKLANKWEYAGMFSVERWSEDPDDLARFEESSGRMNLTRIVFLIKVV